MTQFTISCNCKTHSKKEGTRMLKFNLCKYLFSGDELQVHWQITSSQCELLAAMLCCTHTSPGATLSSIIPNTSKFLSKHHRSKTHIDRSSNSSKFRSRRPSILESLLLSGASISTQVCGTAGQLTVQVIAGSGGRRCRSSGASRIAKGCDTVGDFIQLTSELRNS
jgi:hypothetical protein